MTSSSSDSSEEAWRFAAQTNGGTSVRGYIHEIPWMFDAYTYLCLFHVNTPSLGAQFLKVAWNCSLRSARDKNRGFGCLSLCAQPGRQEESRGLGNVSSAWAGTLGFIFCIISCTRFGDIHTHTHTHARTIQAHWLLTQTCLYYYICACVLYLNLSTLTCFARQYGNPNNRN